MTHIEENIHLFHYTRSTVRGQINLPIFDELEPILVSKRRALTGQVEVSSAHHPANQGHNPFDRNQYGVDTGKRKDARTAPTKNRLASIATCSNDSKSSA